MKDPLVPTANRYREKNFYPIPKPIFPRLYSRGQKDICKCKHSVNIHMARYTNAISHGYIVEGYDRQHKNTVTGQYIFFQQVHLQLNYAAVSIPRAQPCINPFRRNGARAPIGITRHPHKALAQERTRIRQRNKKGNIVNRPTIWSDYPACQKWQRGEDYIYSPKINNRLRAEGG